MMRLLIGLLLLAVRYNAQTIPKTQFSCEGRPSGYYADMETDCEVYHMCDGLGRQFSYSCPNNTLFQQRMLICDHWYMVNCSKSEVDYRANLLIGQRDKPFIEDTEKNPFFRTPRPDLSSNPSVSEYNNIYRRGRSRVVENLNLVGVNSDNDQNDGSASPTGQPTYSLPSHWSTQYSKPSSTPSTLEENKFSNTFQDPKRYKIIKNTQDYNAIGNKKVIGDTIDIFNKIKEKPFNPPVKTQQNNFESSNDGPVNYKSSFRATTPVYPKYVDATSPEPFVDVKRPLQSFLPPRTEGNRGSVQINFESSYKATTPVYPKYVGATSPEPFVDEKNPLQSFFPPRKQVNRGDSQINFESTYKATTPVYPKYVEASSPEPFVDEKNPLQSFFPPRKQVDRGDPQINFESTYKATTPVYPKYVEASSPEPFVDDKNPLQSFLPPKNFVGDNEVKINFESSYKATTPVYPKYVDATSPEPFVDQQNPLQSFLPPQQQTANNDDVQINFESSYKATTPVYPKFVDATSPEPFVDERKPLQSFLPPRKEVDRGGDVQINFESSYKATTPVYPKYVDATSPEPFVDEHKPLQSFLPPKGEVNRGDVQINFESSYKATTPVYPKYVEATSPEPFVDNNNPLQSFLPPQDDKNRENIIQNFASSFKATTPVYPKFVEATSPEPFVDKQNPLQSFLPPKIPINNPSSQSTINDDKPLILLLIQNNSVPSPSLDFEPPPPDNSHLTRNFTADDSSNVAKPSMFYQPPRFDPDFRQSQNVGIDLSTVTASSAFPLDVSSFANTSERTVQKKESINSINTVKQWKDLRQMFLIPDYEFPLEVGSRPGYDNGPSSFQVNPIPVDLSTNKGRSL